MKNSSFFKSHYHIVILLSILALGGAYFAEYILHLSACPLCVYQRFPYLLLIFISLVAVSGNNYGSYSRYLIVTLIIAIIIAAYHTGVERRVFELSSICKPLVTLQDNLSVEDFKRILYTQKPALCNKPALVIFYLSMTEWNLILNIILLVFCIKCKSRI